MIKEPEQTSEVLKTSEVFERGSKRLTPIEKAFRDFFIAYAKAVNKAYNRTGSLFQAKFKKKEIVDDSYFTSVIQYIHANPVKAKLSKCYNDYTFSSYKGIISTEQTLLKREEVLSWFGNREMFIKVHEEKKADLEEIENYLLR